MVSSRVYKAVIYKGEDATLEAQIVDEDGNPKDLSDADEITVSVESETGSPQTFTIAGSEVAIVAGKATSGWINIEMSRTKTALFEDFENGNMQALIVENDGDVDETHTYVVWEGLLTVKEPPIS